MWRNFKVWYLKHRRLRSRKLKFERGNFKVWHLKHRRLTSVENMFLAGAFTGRCNRLYFVSIAWIAYLWSGLAPLSNKNFTKCKWPSYAAKCKAVLNLYSTPWRDFGFACNSALTQAKLPLLKHSSLSMVTLFWTALARNWTASVLLNHILTSYFTISSWTV